MEDRQGEPFVGPAGQLLDKILASIGLSRQPLAEPWMQVYIANIVKCHPMKDPSRPDLRGNDRAPNDQEMETCRPFLMKQIRIIRPRFLLALGATAAKALLRTDRGISAIRGRWFDFSPDGDGPLDEPLQVRLLPTYHPSALLRNPDLKKDVWQDVKALRQALLEAVRKG
jgi:DNA polymerase